MHPAVYFVSNPFLAKLSHSYFEPSVPSLELAKVAKVLKPKIKLKFLLQRPRFNSSKGPLLHVNPSLSPPCVSCPSLQLSLYKKAEMPKKETSSI